MELAGFAVPQRRYSISNHLVVLTGPDVVVHHDADELLGMPDGLYRVLTPGEQEAMVATQTKQGMIQEQEPATPPDMPDAPDAPVEEEAPTTTPALLEVAPAEKPVAKKATGGA